MPYPLTLRTILDRNRLLFGKKEVVTRDFAGIHRYTYAEYQVRVGKLANALKRLGVKRGERVATFGWNSHRHLEAYLAAPCMGAVLHTLNIRLFADQFAYIVNHAEDAVMLVDEDLVPAVEAVADKFPTVRAYVIMGAGKTPPETRLRPAYSYEALLEAESGEYDWPSDIEENAMAALCYTTATTGNPKGVPVSHRGLYPPALALSAADVLGIREADAVMPVVPMFHVNAWGIPFAAVWMGTKQVFPGSRPDPAALVSLIENEKVTITAGVPTIWMAVAQLLEREKHDVSSLTAVICGGSAPTVIEKVGRVRRPVHHAYGMTETYPWCWVSRPKSS
jgi:fatty-acyl-CoA synthase